ncbi:phosphotransferase [Xanthomonas dyei]|uniref:phosphotransferase n=1 Tax=Xanthomonas dyei TaxID=743699 RepID=UPI003607EC6D
MGLRSANASVPGATCIDRDALSWTPFSQVGHAQAAGAALARLHHAAQGSSMHRRAPPTYWSPICGCSCSKTRCRRCSACCPRGRIWPQRLQDFPWQHDLITHLLPWQCACLAAAVCAAMRCPPLWTHGDWHASNLLWNTDHGRRRGQRDLRLRIERPQQCLVRSGHRRHRTQPDPVAAAGYRARVRRRTCNNSMPCWMAMRCIAH